MKYKEPTPISREEAVAAFSSHDPNLVCDALIRITFCYPDWEWVQDTCIELVNSKHDQVRHLAIICLGHLARIHRKLNIKKVSALFERLKKDDSVKGVISDAADDIKMFLGVDLLT